MINVIAVGIQSEPRAEQMSWLSSKNAWPFGAALHGTALKEKDSGNKAKVDGPWWSDKQGPLGRSELGHGCTSKKQNTHGWLAADEASTLLGWVRKN